MTIDRDKLNELLRSPKAWATVAAILAAIASVLGFAYPDILIAAFDAVTEYFTGSTP